MKEAAFCIKTSANDLIMALLVSDCSPRVVFFAAYAQCSDA